MRIRASRVDDIRKAKEEYETGRARRQEQYDQQERAYQDDERWSAALVEDAIRSQLGTVGLEAFFIQVKPSWNRGWEVRVGQENHHSVRTIDALSWDMSISLESDGSVKRATNSWSGMNAVTPDQLNELQEIVRVLGELNSMDWAAILNMSKSNYSDFVTMEDPRYEKHPDFDAEMLDAQLDELVGTNRAVHGTAVESTGYRVGVDVWYQILSQTPAMYTCRCASDFEVKDRGLAAINDYGYTIRVKKSTLRSALDIPLEIQDI